MKNLTNPKWLLIINTLPIIILFVLLLGQFNIIKSLLDKESIHYWKVFSLSLGLLGAASLIYTIYNIIKKHNVSFIYALTSIISFVTFLYFYYFYSFEMFPPHIPLWMIDSNTFFFAGTFLMPVIAYSIMILVLHFSAGEKRYKSWINFLIAILIPLSVYLFSQIILPLLRNNYSNPFFYNFLLIILISATLIFFFFLTRGIYIITVRNTGILKKYNLTWKIPLSVIFPVLGLLINNGIIFSRWLVSGDADTGVFGNFNNIWFYILAVLNGIVLCLPDFNNKIFRFIIFAVRSITFSFSLYFFLVFLPFLPFSIIAIIAFGAGFLMLTPLALFIIHITELQKDYIYLKNVFSENIIKLILILGFCLIPALITVNNLIDKIVINKTLEYLYAADYSKIYKINKKSLNKTLSAVKQHKDRNDFFSNSNLPYLSSYFNRIVLNNLTLTNEKIDDIERIFFNKPAFNTRITETINSNVLITNITTESNYDIAEMTWRSWINLEIRNEGQDFAEYLTILNLPAGCYISDYYLYVEDIKEYGILAEKRAAIWVYSNIRNTNRDPGLLHYLSGNKISFRVFPFLKNETRKTGIELLHSEPVTIIIDNNIIELGTNNENKHKKSSAKNAVYVSGEGKKSLNSIQRKPYFHFLVDTSSRAHSEIENFTQRIEKAIEQYPELGENAKISFVNSYVNMYSIGENWKHQYIMQNFDGGFYLERAISIALYNAYKESAYTVITVVTNNMENAILETDFSDFKFAFPESDLFFYIDDEGKLLPHSLIDRPKRQLPIDMDYSFNKTILEYVTDDNIKVYFPDNNESSVALINNIFDITEGINIEKDWNFALELQAKQMSHTLHPYLANKEFLKMVNYSFRSKIMIPLTSYIVVENEAQKAVLLKRQQQVLSGGKLLDLDDTPQMSEPGILALLIMFAALFIKRKKLVEKIKIMR
ncbi:MAG: MSEP-CTERM sorting domain-containing protein [Treponema sp.]|nr:MSEP-CTERM sorting domain-containing protein [Treponema sp.]